MYVDIYREKNGLYSVICKNDKYQDYIGTGRKTKLSAIGYAICEIEYMIHEFGISDDSNGISMFTENELYDIKFKLEEIEEDEIKE